jgi:L-lactate dehydrogenase
LKPIAQAAKSKKSAGDYADLSGTGLVMITAGVNEKSGGATDRST